MARPIDNRYRIAGTSAVLFCLALFLTAFSAKNPSLASFGASATEEILFPFRVASSAVSGGLGNVWGSYIDLVGVERANEALRRRLETLEAENSRLAEIAQENIRLRSLLKVVDEVKLPTLMSSVIGYDVTNWIQAISIDKGRNHGLQKGMPVLGANGVVGQIIAAGLNSSKVLLLSDPVSGIDALVQDSRARGIVEGVGNGLCQWRFVSESDEVKVGDKLITSGADGVYPKGLLIGVISEIEERGKTLSPVFRLQPAQDLDRLENVLVVLPPTSAASGSSK